MKLNLLPTYVTKGKATRTAVIVSVLIFLASVAASIGMTLAAEKRLDADKSVEEEMRPRAQATVDTFAYATSIVSDPQVKTVMTDTKLAQAIIAHNSKYPNFYNRFLRYIPPFFRLTSIQATPIDDKTSTVTMTGVLKTYQQYADLMLALLRYPNAVSVGRAGYQSQDLTVPPLSANDQTGRALKPGETPLPSNPLERLQYLENQNYGSQGYTGVGGFGSGQEGTRGAMPGYSTITVTMTVKDNLQVPDIAGTLSQAGGGGTTTTASSPMGGFGAPPGMPPMGGMGGPPGMPPMGGSGMGGPAGGAPGMPGAGLGATRGD